MDYKIKVEDKKSSYGIGKKLLYGVAGLALLTSVGCSTLEKAVIGGALIGAGGGAIIGYQSLEVGEGIAIGLAAGAATGAVVAEE